MVSTAENRKQGGGWVGGGGYTCGARERVIRSKGLRGEKLTGKSSSNLTEQRGGKESQADQFSGGRMGGGGGG